jgi:hypothetical protein
MSARSIILLLLCVVLIIFLSSLFIPSLNMIMRNIELAISGILRVAGAAPEVIEIYVSNDPSYSLCDLVPPGPQINGLGGSTVNLRFNATIYDLNGDCNNANVYVYMCKNTTGLACNSGRADYNSQMILFQRDTYYCNYTTNIPSTLPLDYFERYGNWYVNVTATDAGNPALTNNTVRYWYYNEFTSALYPVGGGGVVDLGTINLDAWSIGGENTTRNTGNIRLNLTWNATDFDCSTPGTCGSDSIAIDGTNFCTDNDTSRSNGCGYINTDPSVRIEYFPSGGMRRCGNFVCDMDEDNNVYPNSLSNYTLWWHIYATSPKGPGIYTNSIEVVGRYYYQEG